MLRALAKTASVVAVHGTHGLPAHTATYQAVAAIHLLAARTAPALPIYAQSGAQEWRTPWLQCPTRGFSAALPQQNDDAPPEADEGAKLHLATAEGLGTDHKPFDDETNVAPHRGLQEAVGRESYLLFNPVYTQSYVESVKPVHKPPRNLHDRVGMYTVQVMRSSFDFFTGYKLTKPFSEAKWLQRILFLETVAGVPGMVGGMMRHMRSLRDMRRDHGWIHTLLEEAENERMHLLTFLKLRDPGIIFRGMVVLGQGVFFNLYLLAYVLSPKTCHSFVGYLEEEAVKTYTHAIHDLDSGKLPEWANKPAPDLAIEYWKLKENATMRDLLLAVRADEACHSHVNHTFAGLKKYDTNPFAPGNTMHVA